MQRLVAGATLLVWLVYVFFIAGESDPVGDMGKGVRKTAERFRRAGMRDVSLRLYPGRHEILNEPNRKEVYEDVRKFLEKNIKKVTIS